MTTMTEAGADPASAIDSRRAWIRAALALAAGSIGSVGMWSFVVVLPAVQADFGVTRGEASLAFTITMAGFGLGGIVMGRLADRFGVFVPIALGGVLTGLGYVSSAYAAALWQFALAQAVLGFGTSGSFGPLMSDMTQWFMRRRGIAVAIVSCGNYLCGAVWSPIIERMITTHGWRFAQIVVGLVCLVLMLPLALGLRQRAPAQHASQGAAASADRLEALGVSSRTLMILLFIAGIACCVAMAMPQVHIVAYCGDLGYGPARGAEMLSLMLAFGLVSRLASGFVADRIGGVATLLLSSALQGFALLLYLFFDGLSSLYVISALFGLFQGGLIPMYAIVVREYFAPREAGTRLGIILFATLGGMALGGWLSGLIFDLTGSYQAAFLNGLGWNLVNMTIVGWLLLRPSRIQNRAIPA